MLLRFFISVVALCYLLVCEFSHAARVGGLELSADNISRDYETRTVLLEGNVLIDVDGEKLTCDKARIQMLKQEIIAEGKVTLETSDTYIEGEKIVYNYKTKLGEIHKGYVQAGQVVFIGDLIQKESAINYIANDATYTSCRTCPAAWSFSGKKIKAEIGGYAYITYPVFRVADFPIFILPRILVPLKSTRQSGFLIPSLDYSSGGGTAITLPYFWAISRNQDLTYALKSYQKRGFKHKTDYRYIIAEGSGGAISAAYLHDKTFTASGDSNDQQQELRRGFLSYQHHFDLPNGFTQRAKFNIVSDLRYPRDFSDEIIGHGYPALENQMSLTKNTQDQHFRVEATHYTNLLKEEALTDNSDAVHRFPEIQYSIMEREILNTNLFLKLDLNYTNFSRRNFSYDDVDSSGKPVDVHDGKYNYSTSTDKKDLIRTGQRYIVQPVASYPFHIGTYLDVNPTATFNSTYYLFNVASDKTESDIPGNTVPNYSRSAASQFLQTDISFKTKYSAVYGIDNKISDRYKHEIEPEIIFSRIPYAQRPNHVFFGNFQDQPYARRSEPPSNADVTGASRVQFDYRDRLFDKNIVSFVLNNYAIRKTYLAEGADYKKFITFRLAQSYDINQAESENSRPWSAINGLIDLRTKNFETHSTVDYYPYAKVANFSPRMFFLTNLGNYLELTYSNKVIVQEDQVTSSQRTETVGVGLGFKTKYLDFNGTTNYLPVTRQIESWKYSIVFKPPGDCWSLNFIHNKTTGSDSNYKVDVNFVFSGI